MGVRVRGLRRREARSDRSGASIREVCLLGGAHKTPGWSAGGRLRWAGRSYVIAALEGGPDRPHYAHLAAASAGDSERDGVLSELP